MGGEKARWENSAEVELLQKDVSAVKMPAGEQIGALAASLEQAGKEGGELYKKIEAAAR